MTTVREKLPSAARWASPKTEFAISAAQVHQPAYQDFSPGQSGMNQHFGGAIPPDHADAGENSSDQDQEKARTRRSPGTGQTGPSALARGIHLEEMRPNPLGLDPSASSPKVPRWRSAAAVAHWLNNHGRFLTKYVRSLAGTGLPVPNALAHGSHLADMRPNPQGLDTSATSSN